MVEYRLLYVKFPNEEGNAILVMILNLVGLDSWVRSNVLCLEISWGNDTYL